MRRSLIATWLPLDALSFMRSSTFPLILSAAFLGLLLVFLRVAGLLTRRLQRSRVIHFDQTPRAFLRILSIIHSTAIVIPSGNSRRVI